MKPLLNQCLTDHLLDTMPSDKIRNALQLAWSENPADRTLLRGKLRKLPLVGRLVRIVEPLLARLSPNTPADYVRMQKAYYQRLAGVELITPGNIERDEVVGSWKLHDEWPDYEAYLMRYVPPDGSMVALEYGCGPGRNIRRWSGRFRRIDGVDIWAQNFVNAEAFLQGQIPPQKTPQFFLTQGMDCGEAPREHYDFAFSTICLQHICVHEVRFSIFRSLFECLKPGGRLSVQMGYGTSPGKVGYFHNYVEATGTNGECDVTITSAHDVRDDLLKIGYIDFEFWIRPVGPGDHHENWIFFTARKPGRDLGM